MRPLRPLLPLRRRPAAVVAAPLLSLLLLGCSSEATTSTGPTPTVEVTDQVTATPDPAPESPSSSSPSSSNPEPVIERIPGDLRRAFLNEPYTVQTSQWEPRAVTRAGQTTVEERRVPACDNDPSSLRAMGDRLYSEPLSADRSVLGFGAEVTTPRDGYVVARQLTLFPDARTAEAFVREWADPGCFTYQGRFLAGTSQSTGANRDRFFEVPRADGGPATRFREGYFASAGGAGYRYVDIFSRVANALTLTRVVGEDYDVQGISIISSKKDNPEFVAQVRSEGRTSVRLLDRLARGA